MKVLVTGAAGFIGSTLCEKLRQTGHEVLGLDAFTDYYDRSLKERNLADLTGRPGFSLLEIDLVFADLVPVMKGVDLVYHLAAQPGVRASWGDGFSHYSQNNVLGTQRVMEACARSGVRRLVYASSSSVYGDCPDLPAREDSPLRPVSPYGVTKAATEHLGYLYYKNHGLETVGLRYFTVYGPRQRPDMAFHRFIRSVLEGRAIAIYGDGLQSRDFTYVGDAVAATIGAGRGGRPGTVYNIGGGSRIVLREVLDHLGRILGQPPLVEYQAVVKGDVRHTASDCSRAKADFGYDPATDFATGLAAEVDWMKALLAR